MKKPGTVYTLRIRDLGPRSSGFLFSGMSTRLRLLMLARGLSDSHRFEVEKVTTGGKLVPLEVTGRDMVALRRVVERIRREVAGARSRRRKAR